jgi:hypothetical protein
MEYRIYRKPVQNDIPHPGFSLQGTESFQPRFQPWSSCSRPGRPIFSAEVYPLLQSVYLFAVLCYNFTHL